MRQLERQIQFLRQLIDKLAVPSERTVAMLHQVRADVVETVGKAIAMIGRYAGSCLPDGNARNTVRSFILGLPGRWAHLNSDLINSAASNASSGMASPLLVPGTPKDNVYLTEQEKAGQLLALATESLLTLKSVAGVFGETVECAEEWSSKLGY